jgi:hypothetical protein
VRIGGKLLDLDEAVAVLSPGSGYVKFFDNLVEAQEDSQSSQAKQGIEHK